MSARTSIGRLLSGVDASSIAMPPGGRILRIVGRLLARMKARHRRVGRDPEPSEGTRGDLGDALAVFFEAHPHPMWIHDERNLRFLAVNEAAIRTFGYSRDEFLERHVADLLPGEIAARLANRGTEPVVAERRTAAWLHRRRDGSSVWVEASARTEEFQGRRAALVLACDVTEQKQAEVALRDSEARYRQSFEEDISGNYIADVEGRILACNREFLRIFGFASRGDALQTNLSTLHELPETHWEVVETVLRDGRVVRKEVDLRRIDGTRIHVIENVIGVFDDAGDLVQTRGYLVDITGRKALEAQLHQSQKMEAMGQLAGGVAHDFNNMLTAITGYAHALLDRLGSDDALRADVLAIREVADRSAELTRQLLAFSRKQILQPRVIPLNDIIAGIEGILRRLIGDDVALEIRLHPDTGCVNVDPAQMEQVVVNLAVNGRDAMPGTGTLTIATFDEEVTSQPADETDSPLRPGRYAVLEVSDTGHGMDEKTRSMIFEPFFTTKGVGRGTGLGLSTVYGVVTQSRGHILVDSEPGRGSTFRIYLPVTDAGQEARNPAIATVALPGGSGTVLLVEDDAAVRKFIARILRRSGYSVLEVSSGDAAVALLQRTEQPIHLLITDVMLPGMSIRSLVRAVTRRSPSIPVLYMSGYAEDVIAHRGVLDPGIELLPKPFTPTALLTRVQKLLRRPEAE